MKQILKPRCKTTSDKAKRESRPY